MVDLIKNLGEDYKGFGLNLVTSTNTKWEFDPPEKWWDQLGNDQKTCFTLPGGCIFRTPLLCVVGSNL